MNQLHKTIIATLVFLFVAFFLGRLIFLSGIQREIMHAENRLVQLEENQAILNIDLEKLRQGIKAEVKVKRSNFLTKPGEEQKLLKSVIDCGGPMRIKNFSILPAYRVKGSEDSQANFGSSDKSGFNPEEELPQLDDQGMPVGVSTEDDYEWPGAEIIPVKFSFATTYRNLGQFFAEVQKTMPVNVIRSMDLIVKSSGICRGTIVLLFPVSGS
jgi:hypothetical protein